jgi:predicted nucleic acid-binding protein
VIVLDTNVVSEPIKPSPDPAVLAWVSAQTQVLAVTAVTLGELFAGVSLLPAGARRERLAQMVEHAVGSIAVKLGYDEKAARVCADIREISKRQGRTMTVEGAMTAAICVVNSATLATRNTKDFEHLPLPLANPFADPPGPSAVPDA